MISRIRGLGRTTWLCLRRKRSVATLQTTGQPQQDPPSRKKWKLVQYSGTSDVVTAVLGDGEVQLEHRKKRKQGIHGQQTQFQYEHVSAWFYRTRNNILSYFLPEGYPSSVDASYTPYVAWHATCSVLGTCMSVLSMQAMFHSVGLGAGALPVAAVVNWVLKDGIGQLGGVLFASSINTNFDTNPKKWRFVSGLVMDSSCLLEACTCFYPALFLPIASLANIGKNVGWLSASATKAGIHQALARHGNLSDVTAKSGSQTIAASTLGTGLGAMLCTVTSTNFYYLFGIMIVLSGSQLFCLHKSLKSVVLPTLSVRRTELALENAIYNASSSNELDASLIRYPKDVAALEPVLLDWKVLKQTLSKMVGRRVPVEHCTDSNISINVNPKLNSTNSKLIDEWAQEHWEKERTYQYALATYWCTRAEMHYIDVFIPENANWKDNMSAIIHALCTKEVLYRHYHGLQKTHGAHSSLHDQSHQLYDSIVEIAISKLDENGWWIGQPYFTNHSQQHLEIEEVTQR